MRLFVVAQFIGLTDVRRIKPLQFFASSGRISSYGVSAYAFFEEDPERRNLFPLVIGLNLKFF